MRDGDHEAHTASLCMGERVRVNVSYCSPVTPARVNVSNVHNRRPRGGEGEINAGVRVNVSYAGMVERALRTANTRFTVGRYVKT